MLCLGRPDSRKLGNLKRLKTRVTEGYEGLMRRGISGGKAKLHRGAVSKNQRH